jgi:nucleotide-binding universal stress UspA family protein
MYKKLLVAYDGSEPSAAAVMEAALWVRKHKGELTLLHVVYFDSEEFGIAPVQHEARLARGAEICAAIKDRIATETGVAMETLLRDGEPPEVIVEMARTLKPDLVVMGTYGRRGLKRFILGSVASEVIVGSPVDVLVVKKKCAACTGEYSSIMLPYDGSKPAEEALRRSCSMAADRGSGTHVTALYVIRHYEEMVEFFKTESISRRLWSEADKILKGASGYAASQGLKIDEVIREGSAPQAIVEAAEAAGADLIVMGSHGYRGVNKALLGSTAEGVIKGASCPVLVVK